MDTKLRFAGWSGILGPIFFVISYGILLGVNWTGRLGESADIIMGLIFLIVGVFAVIYLISFITLGKKYESKLLIIIGWIHIIFFALFFFSIVLNQWGVYEKTSPYETYGLEGIYGDEKYEAIAQLPEDQQEEISKFESLRIIFLILYIAVYSIITILLGVGLIKISKKYNFARPVGIMEIIAGATMFIGIGIFVKFSTFIMELILIFKVSGSYASEADKRRSKFVEIPQL